MGQLKNAWDLWYWATTEIELDFDMPAIWWPMFFFICFPFNAKIEKGEKKQKGKHFVWSQLNENESDEKETSTRCSFTLNTHQYSLDHYYINISSYFLVFFNLKSKIYYHIIKISCKTVLFFFFFLNCKKYLFFFFYFFFFFLYKKFYYNIFSFFFSFLKNFLFNYFPFFFKKKKIFIF